MPVPTQCQALADEMEGLKQERADLQTELKVAPPGHKPALAGKIKQLNSLIGAKRPALDACIAQYGDPPPPPPIASMLTGPFRLTTNRNFSGEPFLGTVAWGLLFDGSRTQVFVTSFPPLFIDTTPMANIVGGPFGFFFGPNITTISRTGGGSGIYSKAAGTMVLPLTLRFDHSRDLPFYEEDSNLSIVLSTAGSPGAFAIGAGLVDLAGTGVFTGGWLGGVSCTIAVEGNLFPKP